MHITIRFTYYETLSNISVSVSIDFKTGYDQPFVRTLENIFTLILH